MREGQQDRFDDALDSALASYGKAPESDGLERRVLSRVTGRTRRERPLGRLTIAMGAAMAAVCCLVWIEAPKTTEHSLTANKIRPQNKLEGLAVQSTPARDVAVVLPRASQRRRMLKSSAEPKLAQFPAPSPMGSEERALLRLAKGDAKDIPRELIKAGEPIEPLRIAAIEIKPLE